MAQEVVTIWCEWEMGFEGEVFGDMETAVAAAKQCFADQGADFEEALNGGLITFDEIEITVGKRYRLASDDDGHDFLIPADKSSEWEDFVADPEAYDWEPPEWAEPCAYHPSNMTFTNPEWD